MAAQGAGVHEMVERLRSEWNSRTGQDPFEVSVDHVLPEVGGRVSFNPPSMSVFILFPHLTPLQHLGIGPGERRE